jgi:hypothetical protein
MMTNNFKMLQVENSGVADPGCLFRITALNFFFPGSRVRKRKQDSRSGSTTLIKQRMKYFYPNCYVAMSNMIRDVSQILDPVVSSPIQG